FFMNIVMFFMNVVMFFMNVVILVTTDLDILPSLAIAVPIARRLKKPHPGYATQNLSLSLVRRGMSVRTG
ncbi:hypothetical protein, partial [uncultured Nostoc sp.]|uniref:hypothetical protein n=1 Tax=uncultured Nostoc sp. TaxID=340711 RepID=UPI0035CAE4C6